MPEPALTSSNFGIPKETVAYMKSEFDKYILYADDDMDDQETLKDTLLEVAPEISLVSVQDGIQLLDFLNSLPPGSKFPCLLLVDMNMPKINGIEALKILKADPVYKDLPVIVFSTAETHSWIQMAKELGAEDYVIKPVSFERMREVTTQFADHCEVVPPVKN